MEQKRNSNFNLYAYEKDNHQSHICDYGNYQFLPCYSRSRKWSRTDLVDKRMSRSFRCGSKTPGVNNDRIREGGAGMSWRYSAPQRCDFDSEDEYKEAVSYYEDAADMYAEEYMENSRW